MRKERQKVFVSHVDQPNPDVHGYAWGRGYLGLVAPLAHPLKTPPRAYLVHFTNKGHYWEYRSKPQNPLIVLEDWRPKYKLEILITKPREWHEKGVLLHAQWQLLLSKAGQEFSLMQKELSMWDAWGEEIWAGETVCKCHYCSLMDE